MKKGLFVFKVISILFLSLFLFNFFPKNKLPKNTKIDSLIVFKAKRELQAWEKGVLVKKYKISLGKKPIGDKQIEGDNKTPEGIYIIFDKNPQSDYHNNLGISYPNKNDIENAQKLGKPPGFDIKIHGLPNGFGFFGEIYKNFDWTAGCIAITNAEIDELSKATEIGTPIFIFP